MSCFVSADTDTVFCNLLKVQILIFFADKNSFLAAKKRNIIKKSPFPASHRKRGKFLIFALVRNYTIAQVMIAIL